MLSLICIKTEVSMRKNIFLKGLFTIDAMQMITDNTVGESMSFCKVVMSKRQTFLKKITLMKKTDPFVIDKLADNVQVINLYSDLSGIY